MHRAIADLGQRLEATPPRVPGAGAPQAEEAVKELAKGVDQLVRQMRAEQKVVREWVDEQAARQSEMSAVLKDLAQSLARRGG
jgi:DNA-binding ferritin-like protein